MLTEILVQFLCFISAISAGVLAASKYTNKVDVKLTQIFTSITALQTTADSIVERVDSVEEKINVLTKRVGDLEAQETYE